MIIRTKGAIVTFEQGATLSINPMNTGSVADGQFGIVHVASGSPSAVMITVCSDYTQAERFIEEVWEAIQSGETYLDLSSEPDTREIEMVNAQPATEAMVH